MTQQWVSAEFKEFTAEEQGCSCDLCVILMLTHLPLGKMAGVILKCIFFNENVCF